MAKYYGLNAAGEDANIQRGDLVRFLPEDLLPFQDNYRFGATDSDPAVIAERDKEIEKMVRSLCENGQKMPVKIHGVSGNRFQVHAGDTRHLAFLRINERKIWPFSHKDDPQGIARVECTVDTNGDPKRTFGTSITENIARNELNVIDMANAVSIATDDYKFTDAEILRQFEQAKLDGTAKDPAWLPNMRRLARLPVERKREIYLGLMAASVGYLLAEIPEERHAEVLAEAAGETVVMLDHQSTKSPILFTQQFGRILRPTPPLTNDDPRAETWSELHPREAGDVLAEAAGETLTARKFVNIAALVRSYTCPDCGPTEPDSEAGTNCGQCHQPYDMDALENPAPPEQAFTERTLDYTESQTAPVIQPNKQPKKRKKVTARAVAEVAKSKGLLAHKKVGHTLAGMREFWRPYAEERNAETRIGQLAAASLAWMDSGADDDFFNAIKKILKETK